MKKILLIALAVAIGLCMPITAQAKAEFELGGYIRVDAIWHTQSNFTHSYAAFVTRDNANFANHGRFLMNANATRFNFTIKGPELWGGKVTGFIEADFDGFDGTAANNGNLTNYSSFSQAKLRLRHAMFKIAWPNNELLFGQYWSINSELIPETADSGAYCLYGATQARWAQVRWTHKFTDNFNGSVAVSAAQNGRWGLNVNSFDTLEGENSETPMIEGKLRYEADLYGKGAFYGKPRGFYIGAGAAYMRTFSRAGNPYAAGWNTLGQFNFVNTPWLGAYASVDNKYTDHWLFLIENVTPIIPTHTKSLAGTLTLSHQWWIGKGLSAWRIDLPGNDRYYTFSGPTNNGANMDFSLNFIQRYGGHAQLQYYWTEEIYTNINFGFEKAFGWKGNNYNNVLFYNYGWYGRNLTAQNYVNGNNIDPVNSSWRASITQWYRPVSAVKFALQYTYMRVNYFQDQQVGSWTTNTGEVHSVMANAWYLF